MFSFRTKGSFKNLENFLREMRKKNIYDALNRYGRDGVAALESMTPKRSGITASSWYYEIESGYGSYAIAFHNSNINKGVNIAIILQLGHGTGTGGYVAGRDYINPALQPTFDKITDQVWKAVQSA